MSRISPDLLPSAVSALTAAGVTFTWTANDPGITDGAATVDDGDTVGDDNAAGDALSAVEDQLNKVVADLATLRTAVNAIINSNS